jgi:hypothetical protein
MKTLKEFISEHLNENKSSSTTISFNFNGVDNIDEILKTFDDFEDFVSVNEKTVTVTVNEKTVAKIGAVKDILSQAISAERNGTRSTNDEQYAQKIAKLESGLKDLDNAIAELQSDDSKDETPKSEKPQEKEDDDKKDNDNE